jgi:hypothetical protein
MKEYTNYQNQDKNDDINIDSTDAKRITKKNYEQLFANKVNNFSEMGKSMKNTN